MNDEEKLIIICSHEKLLEYVKCFPADPEDHQENLSNIIKFCEPYYEDYKHCSSFNVYDYLASYISEKDKYWDYNTNKIEIIKLLYTWITVGYKNKLVIHKFLNESSENILYKLTHYNSEFWYIKIKRPHVKKKYDALIKGLQKCNKIVKKTTLEKDCGCGFFAGVLDGNMNVIKNTRRYLYIDNAYTPDKYKEYYSLSVNDLQYLCDYDVSDTRFKKIYNGKYNNYIFNNEGDYILICPPSITMGEFYNIDIDSWIYDTIGNVRKYSDKKCILRIKPNEYNYNSNKSIRIENIRKRIKNYNNVDISNECSSTDAINNACLVIGFNSRILVESILAGKPILCSNHCVCYTMSQSNYKIALESPSSNEEYYKSWINKLCYSQWTLDEISKGLFSEYIKLF